MSEICISSVSYDECMNDLLEFRNQNREQKRDTAYFTWRYIKRPNKAQPIIVWAEADGRKVACLSLILHHFFVGDEKNLMGILGDISVSKSWRGKGIAKKMFEYLTGMDEVKKLSACVVLPNKDAARPLGKAGWTKVSRLDRYVKILDSEKILKKKN